jgi:dTDP-4-amino-4,6-dideoxygalactose transaminase
LSPEPLLPSNPLAGYLAHRDEIDAAMEKVMLSGRYILGEEVAAFESEFAHYTGTREGVGVASGTDALLLALRACEVGPGDKVVTVSHTAVATICAIELCGATPVLVDIDPATFTIDLNLVEETLRGDQGHPVKAIVPVHLYGLPVNMAALMELADRYGVRVVEDCAQAHGARWEGRRVGSFGHIGAFSFYPTKNLGAFGDGGALLTSDPILAERARTLRQYGWTQRYISEIQGMNSRLDELQAAILRVKLRHLDHDNALRRGLAGRYHDALSQGEFVLPNQPPAAEHVFHQYVLRSRRRDELKTFLKVNRIETAILYPVPVHLQNAYIGKIRVGAGGLRHTENACAEILSLPMYPELRSDQIDGITNVLERWAARIDLS